MFMINEKQLTFISIIKHKKSACLPIIEYKSTLDSIGIYYKHSVMV